MLSLWSALRRARRSYLIAILTALILPAGLSLGDVAARLVDRMPVFVQERRRMWERVQRSLQPQLGSPFALIDQYGRHVCSQDLKGRYLLISFGYSSCSGLCATSTRDMIRALEKLGDGAGRVVPIFVTLDPERDRVERLARYAEGYRYPPLLALTGPPQEIRRVANAYRVFYRIGEHRPGEDYAVSHSALIYLVGPDGEVLALFAPHTDPVKMARKIAGYFRPG